MEEQLLLREHSGQPWSLEYLEQLPLANAEENIRESDTRYLLPRRNIFTFGLQNGITERVVYYACKICRALVKPHDVKAHIVSKHPNQDENEPIATPTPISTPPQPSTSKTKKSSHKSKKKIIPPPSVPPPPLFPKTELPPPPPPVVSTPSVTEDLLPPILQLAEAVEKNTASRIPQEKIVTTTETLTSITTTTAATAVRIIANTTTAAVISTTSAFVSKTSTISSTITSAQQNLPTEGLMLPPSVMPKVLLRPKAKDRSSKSEKESSRRRHSKSRSSSRSSSRSRSRSSSSSSSRSRSRRSKSRSSYHPDKYCGVLDSSKRPCMRALTCANHTIVERRAVHGRSKTVDMLISAYKSSKLRTTKPTPIVPLPIAPKQSSSLKEVRNGFRVIELIYEKDSQTVLGSLSFKSPDNPVQSGVINPIQSCVLNPVQSCVLDSLTVMSHRGVATLPKEGAKIEKPVKPVFSVPLKPELRQMTRSRRLPPGTFLKVSLSHSTSSLQGTKYTDMGFQTSVISNAHPKPMTMPTAPMRRVGSSLLLQQAPRIERQRVDLQTVANQHKQLKPTVQNNHNKSVALFNSHNKQSLLKSNIKNIAKVAPMKRPAVVDKPTTDIKHVKVIASEMNGFIVNTEFPENGETQSAVITVQEKTTLLK